MLTGLFCAAAVPERFARGEDYVQEFDGAETVWRPELDNGPARVIAHRLNEHQKRSGTHAEQITLTTEAPTTVSLVHQLPTMAHVIDELKLSLQLQGYRSGVQVYLRVVFPYQVDPKTGKPLAIVVAGDKYTNLGRWQELRAAVPQKQLESQIRVLRAELNDPNLNVRDPMVDQVVVHLSLLPGTTELLFDKLQLGPIAPPQREEILQATATAEAQEINPPSEVRLRQIMVGGQPFFPRIVPYHGEDPAELAAMGINVVWVPNLEDPELIAQFREHGISIMATPPLEQVAAMRPAPTRKLDLPAFGPDSADVHFWYVGTRIAPEDKDKLIAWRNVIRSADQQLRRPIMADVTGLERVYGDHVELLSVSRHVINTSMNFKQYRDWLIERQMVSSPFAVLLTWLQTEPTTGHRKARGPNQALPVIEPEQIHLQAFAALSACCRGVGYWTTGSLTDDGPGATERRLAITQTNLEISLIEDILASGKLTGTVPFRLDGYKRPVAGQRQLDFQNAPHQQYVRDAQLRVREAELRRQALVAKELEAAIISSGQDRLVLMEWYEHDAQFVPEKLAADKAVVVVEGAPDTAHAYEVTATSIKCFDRQIETQRVAGGLQINLEHFDRTAILIVSTDPNLLQRMSAKITKTAPRSAEVSVELARTKLDRVRQMRETLQSLQVDQLDAPALLNTAEQHLQQAEAALERAKQGTREGVPTAFSEYDLARRESNIALQALRVLQRGFWDDATRGFTSPVGSPHTVAFQTLPDHRILLGQLGRSMSQSNENLLPSGNFEDRDTWIADGWEHSQNAIDGIHAGAELHPAKNEGSYALRLFAGAPVGTDPPRIVPRSPVTVTSPAIPVYSGQILHISGSINVPDGISGSQDGVMVYDNQMGVVGALRWKESTGGWKRFEMIREVHENRDFRLTIALMGMGRVELDDLKVIAHDPKNAEQAPPTQAQERPSTSPLDFLGRLPEFRKSLQRR